MTETIDDTSSEIYQKEICTCCGKHKMCVFKLINGEVELSECNVWDWICIACLEGESDVNHTEYNT